MERVVGMVSKLNTERMLKVCFIGHGLKRDLMAILSLATEGSLKA